MFGKAKIIGVASVFIAAAAYQAFDPAKQNDNATVPQSDAPHVVDNQLIFRLRSGNEGCIEYVVDAREQAVRQNPCRQPVPNH